MTNPQPVAEWQPVTEALLQQWKDDQRFVLASNRGQVWLGHYNMLENQGGTSLHWLSAGHLDEHGKPCPYIAQQHCCVCGWNLPAPPRLVPWKPSEVLPALSGKCKPSSKAENLK